MTETTDDVGDARRTRHRAIRAELAQEESEAADADIAEQAVQAPREQLTEDDVESIARRVAREELHRG